MKKQLLKSALIALAGVGLLSGSGWALEIGFDTLFNSSTPTIKVLDNGAGDTAGALGYITTSQSFGIWNMAIANGVNLLQAGGTNPEFDLNSIALSSTGAGDLYVMLAQQNVNTTSGWNITVGGTTDGTVEFFWLVDLGNGLWGDLTSYNKTSGLVNGNFTDNYHFSEAFSAAGLSGTYSIVLGAHVYHKGLQTIENTSFNLAASAVPEPATMLLFGTGLAGLAGVIRRKK